MNREAELSRYLHAVVKAGDYKKMSPVHAARQLGCTSAYIYTCFWKKHVCGFGYYISPQALNRALPAPWSCSVVPEFVGGELSIANEDTGELFGVPWGTQMHVIVARIMDLENA